MSDYKVQQAIIAKKKTQKGMTFIEIFLWSLILLVATVYTKKYNISQIKQ